MDNIEHSTIQQTARLIEEKETTGFDIMEGLAQSKGKTVMFST
jgi:hypothetical protein